MPADTATLTEIVAEHTARRGLTDDQLIDLAHEHVAQAFALLGQVDAAHPAKANTVDAQSRLATAGERLRRWIV